jgi:hypothetical protein
MNRLKTTFALLAVLTAGFAPSMQADEKNKETRLTISRPLQVQDTLLAPGNYDFKLVEPGLVSIYNVDRNRSEGLVVGWLGIPAKSNAHSERKPNSIPG